MYEQHFGLKKPPFIAKVAGTGVFVGPQTATTMANLKKALHSQDAVVAVSGPAGVGKTTLVAKALRAIATTHKSVRIGRLQLQGTDALEFLLEELGSESLPKGPIRQFAALRQRLGQLEGENTRVVVVIEDAARVGPESLAELEALTAADAGDSGGAAIVLMGDSGLDELLQEPQLTRLAQRVRQRHTIEPLCAAEMRGYVMHCFRLAGVDFEHIFERGSSDLVHELCGGIPRMANNIVEGVLAAAAAGGLLKIPSSYVADVAKNEFGLEAVNFIAAAVAPQKEPVAEPEPEPQPEPVPEPEPEPEPVPGLEQLPELQPKPVAEQLPELQPEPVAEQLPELQPEPVAEQEPASDPVIVFSDETEIPELIQDTLPNLEILAPEVVAAESAPEEFVPELQPEPAALPELEPVLEVQPQPQPEPEPEPEPEPVPLVDSAAADVPEWERDPTLAQLRPDLDALEKAMALAKADADDEPEFVPIGVVDTPTPVAEPEPEVIPEITLDNAIQSRIEDHLIDEPGQIGPTAPEAPAKSNGGSDVPEIKIAPRKAKKADAELEKIAAELAKAKTLEDVDDKLAETLFGEELNLIAAQVVANAASAESANDEQQALFDTNAAQMAQASGSTTPEPAVAAESGVEVSLETREHGGEGGLDLSASQRLKTVRALNANVNPSPHEPECTPPPVASSEPPTPVATPEPIEDQINTSMTQTLKALNVRPPISDNQPTAYAEDDEEEERSGFFSRFRRT